MSTLLDFLRIECNPFIRDLLVETIDKALTDNSEFKELTFNIYSVEIFAKKGEVILYHDIDADEKPVSLSLNDFYTAVKNYAG